MARAYVATYGCRVNQADSDGLRERLAAADFTAADSHRDADLVVINSCTVTHRSDADVRKLVHRIERENPRAKVVVAGCYAQRDPEAARRLSGVAAVVGTVDAGAIGAIGRSLLASSGEPGEPGTLPPVFRTELEAVDPAELPPVSLTASVQDRTRPFLKIQEGCDASCTYCVIPSVRGPARSATPDRVLAAVQRLIDQGFFEVVLTGIHLGTYGHKLSGAMDLESLVRQILRLPGLGRLRLSCIEPMAFPLGLADLAAEDSRLAPHFHLPLQAGSDRVLKRMVRPYRAADFIAQVRAIRARVPHAAIGTDVIVGFPGESEAEFLESMRVLDAAGIDYAHVFSYSDRPGVPSTRLRGKVGSTAIKDRARRLIARASDRWQAFLDRQIATLRPALTLDTQPEGWTEALSDNYCRIRLDGPPLPRNRALRVRVTGRSGEFLLGRVYDPLPLLAAPPESGSATVGG